MTDLDQVTELAVNEGSRPEDQRKTFTAITRSTFLDAWEHTAGLILALLSIWLVHWVLERLFGVDERFFDYLPLKYIIDLAEVVVLGRFIWQLLRSFTK